MDSSDGMDDQAKIELRRAKASDVGKIADLIREVAPIAFKGVGTQKQLDAWLDHHADEARVRERVAGPGTISLLAVQPAGHLVGTGFVDLARPEGIEDSAYLGGVYCRERRKGVGTALMKALIDHARQAGKSRVKLGVGVENEAMQLLVASFGFQRLETYRDRDFFTADRFYTCELAL